MEITKVVLFVTTILFPVDCFVRVDNYQNSVYIQKNLGDPFTPASSITFLEPAIFDYMSVDTETAVDGVSQRGHLVQFYKYMYRKGYLTLFPQLSLRYYFTNEQYYQNVSKILMEQMTDNPVIRVRTFFRRTTILKTAQDITEQRYKAVYANEIQSDNEENENEIQLDHGAYQDLTLVRDNISSPYDVIHNSDK
ncbi:unnamed protein product [Mytilus edulis]|uniref:Uncharacterized protein n=1 Tax=Mytilus edulis TaxID=6550 RepID=A0A8S3RHR9_MYTED|nr:unnamed protein product [Mytilus edulis]